MSSQVITQNDLSAILNEVLSKIYNIQEFQQINSSVILYRIGNIRILHVQGAVPSTTTIPAGDRPSVEIVGTGYATGITANQYIRIGRIVIGTNGNVVFQGANSYFNASTGFGNLNVGSDYIYAEATWMVF